MEDFTNLLEAMVGESTLPRPEYLQFPTLEDLIFFLRKKKIPLSTRWNKGRAKDCGTLFDQMMVDKELQMFESIVNGVNGVCIYRRVFTSRVHYNVPKGKVEYDTSEYVYADGTLTQYNHSPSVARPLEGSLLLVEFVRPMGEKNFAPAKHPINISETMREGESTKDTATRAWPEELGWTPTKRELSTLVPLTPLLIMSAKPSQFQLKVHIPLEQGFVRDGPSESTKYPGLISIKDIHPHTIDLFEHFCPEGYVEISTNKVSVFKWVSITESNDVISESEYD